MKLINLEKFLVVANVPYELYPKLCVRFKKLKKHDISIDEGYQSANLYGD